MPKFPHFAERLKVISGSVFEKFLPKIRQKGEDLVKLHIGDSYRPPSFPLPIDAGFREQHPFFNRYCNTYGVLELRQALAAKMNADNHLPVKEDDIMLTCGASNALNISMMSLLNPGDEVLVLTPCWPFFPGMVRVAGGTVVEAPFYSELFENSDMDIEKYLSGFITPKTVALYLNTPNNPSGKVLNREQLQQVAALARRERLWLISDEAYDGMTYDGREHISVASLPGMFEQTLSIFSFSKVYMFAGLRLGYFAAPHALLKNLNKMMVHQLYSPSTLGQYMMIRPVENRRQWSGEFLADCHTLREIITTHLKVAHPQPEGAYYLFFSIQPYLKGRDYWQVIDECMEAGVSVAPGNDFGKGFENHVRICFAGEPGERLEIAARRLNEVLLK